jgi:hypothetical protein
VTKPRASDRLFECFLPYRQALSLDRWIGGLCEQKLALDAGIPLIPEKKTRAAAYNGRELVPSLRPPGCTPEQLELEIREEQRWRNLSKEEAEAEMEEVANDLRVRLDDPEIWEKVMDDTPILFPREEVARFQQESLETLKKKIVPACNQEASLLEGLVPPALAMLCSAGQKSAEAKTLRAFLEIWDTARMFHEGEPPYSITFSREAAKDLGIDSEMESIRFQTMQPLDPSSQQARKVKKFRAYLGQADKTGILKSFNICPQDLGEIYLTIPFGTGT